MRLTPRRLIVGATCGLALALLWYEYGFVTRPDAATADARGLPPPRERASPTERPAPQHDQPGLPTAIARQLAFDDTVNQAAADAGLVLLPRQFTPEPATPEGGAPARAHDAMETLMLTEGAECLRRLDLTGRPWALEFTLVLDAGGLVSASVTGGDAPLPPALVTCLTDAIWSTEWPAVPASATLEMPFSISAGGRPTAP